MKTKVKETKSIGSQPVGYAIKQADGSLYLHEDTNAGNITGINEVEVGVTVEDVHRMAIGWELPRGYQPVALYTNEQLFAQFEKMVSDKQRTRIGWAIRRPDGTWDRTSTQIGGKHIESVLLYSSQDNAHAAAVQLMADQTGGRDDEYEIVPVFAGTADQSQADDGDDSFMIAVRNDLADAMDMVDALIAIETMHTDEAFAKHDGPRTDGMVSLVSDICGNTTCVRVNAPERDMYPSMLRAIHAKLKLIADCAEVIEGKIGH